MNAYASERRTFGGPIRDLGQVSDVGESWAEYRAARAYIYDTANQIDLDQASQRLDSDGVKLFASTVGKQMQLTERCRCSEGMATSRVRGRTALARRQVARDRWRDGREPSEEHHTGPVPRP